MDRLLDLFCCEGAASVGYSRAGWRVYGCDIFEDFKRKRYPFKAYTGDAIDLLTRLLTGKSVLFELDNSIEKLCLDDFTAIAASPPCQHASAGTRAEDRHKYPQLIHPTRKLLRKTGLPYIIENVDGADLVHPILLCGTMFGCIATDADGMPLRLERHRLFESNVVLKAPGACNHDEGFWPAGVYGGSRRVKPQEGDSWASLALKDRLAARNDRGGGYVPRKPSVQEALLGVDWMTQDGRYQAIPPIYTKWLGEQLKGDLVFKDKARAEQDKSFLNFAV